jgi:sulfate adenylyltransferase subunit 2
VRYLDQLEQQSVYIMREVYFRYKQCAILWSTGKDSTVMLWIARKAFLGKIPFPVIHINTGFYPEETGAFRDTYAEEWGLHLVIAENTEAINNGMKPGDGREAECCEALKNRALKEVLQKHSLHTLFSGIRGEEFTIPGTEKKDSRVKEGLSYSNGNLDTSVLNTQTAISYGTGIFKPCDRVEIKTGDEVRIHPLASWTENDVWRYICNEHIPVLHLYFAHQGKRYTQIGCRSCITPVDSDATTINKIIKENEKNRTSGMNGEREKSEDAYTIQKLKSLGYM